MTKLRMKTNFIMIMVLSLLLIGSIGNITENIEQPEKDIDDLQVQCLEAQQDSGNYPVREEIRAKVEGITSYEEHAPIAINGNSDFNDTAYAEGWPGNGTNDNPFIIEGLNITASSGTILISIWYTDVHFQINNCLLVGGSWGIELLSVYHGVIANNTMGSNSLGIYCELSENNSFCANTISDCNYGIRLDILSPNNTILSNTIVNARYGVFSLSGSNRIVNNTFINAGIYLLGSQLSDYVQTEVANNTVNGKPVIYWQGITGGTVPTGAGQIILVNCNSISITGHIFSQTTVGILVAYSYNLIISNNSVFNNQRGILLAYLLNNCTVSNNTAFNNIIGFHLSHCDSNNISNNELTNNSYGFLIDDSTNNVFFRNTVVYNNATGIQAQSSNNNKFYGNIITDNLQYGIYLISCISNDFYGNIIANHGSYGISLMWSKNNIIQWNEFLNNNPSGSSQGYDVDNYGIQNTINYNYWNDWTTPDINLDNIVDNPYSFDGNTDNQDSHPLTTYAHFSPPTVIFPNGGTTVNNLISLQWSSAIDRWGHTVAYTVYYSNDSGSTWISLASGLNTTSYQWDTTSETDGTDYLIKVVATCSAGVSVEDISDSTFIIQNAVVTTPSSPQSLTATAGELFVYLNWTSPISNGGSAITGYQVYRGTSSGEYTVTFVASDTNYNDTLVNGGVMYYYVVTAINVVGESETSSEVNATPTEPTIIQPIAPSAPQSLTATAGELFVTLSWTAPNSDGGSAITSYHVYRGTSSGEYSIIFATLNTEYNDTLVVGITYYYVVTALNTVGESGVSSEFNATPTEPIIIQPVTSSAPQSLTATAGELFVYLTWTAPSSDGGSVITGYHVYRGTSSGEYTVTFVASNTNYNDTLVVGITYYYVVTALNAIGESIFSTEVSATPTVPIVIQLVAPAAPQSLTATAGDLFVSLSWTAPSSDGGSAITSYHVYRGTSSGEYVLLGTTTSTTYNDTLVIGETPFYYVVTAINAISESFLSEEVSATPTGATIPQSGSFPDLLTVLLFLGTAVVFARKKNRF